MADAVYELAVKIGVDASGVEQGLNDVERQVTNSATDIDEGISQRSYIASAAIVAGTAAVAKGAVKAVKALNGLALDSAAYADNLLTQATVTGLSTDALQEYTYMAELVDVSVDTITGSMAKLTKTMSAARNGGKEQTAAFEQLGISITDENGKLRDNNEVFLEIIDALGQMEEGAERDAIIMTLFGRSAQQLNPLIAQGRTGIEKFAAEARELGFVLDEDTLKSLGSLDDSMQRLSMVKLNIRNQLGVAMAPALERIVDKLLELGNKIDWASIGEKLGNALELGADKLIGLFDTIDFDKLLSGAATLFDGLISGLSWILEHADEIVKLVRDIGIGIFAGKAVNGASNIVTAGKNIFGGVSKLFGGAATGAAATGTSAAATSAGTGGLLSGLSLASMIALPATLLGFGVYGGAQNIKSRKSAVSEGLAELEEYAGSEIHTLEEMFQLRRQLNSEYTKAVNETNTETMASTLEGYEGDLNSFIAAEDAAQARYKQSLTMIAEWLNTDEETAREIYNAWLNVQKMQENVDTAQANYDTNQTKKNAKKLDDAEVELSDAQAALAEILSYYQIDLKEGIDTSSMEELPGQAYGWGSDMMASFASGISDGSSSMLIPAIATAAGLVKAYFGHSEPTDGPMSDDSTWMPDMMSGFAKGIRDGAPELRSSNTINVDGHGEDDESLAERIAYQIQVMFDREVAVYA